MLIITDYMPPLMPPFSLMVIDPLLCASHDHYYLRRHMRLRLIFTMIDASMLSAMPLRYAATLMLLRRLQDICHDATRVISCCLLDIRLRLCRYAAAIAFDVDAFAAALMLP